MKKSKLIFLIVFSITFFLLNSGIVSAQPADIAVTETEGTPAVKPQNPSVTLGSKPPQAGPSKKPTKLDIIARIALLTKDMMTRANNILTRLDAIWARVKSRVDKFQAAGKDVSGLAGWIQQVDVKRKAAADAIASGSATIDQIPTPATAKIKIKSFVTYFRSVKKSLKEYHQAILTVIINLKGMSSNTGTGPSVIPLTTKVPSATPSGATVPSATILPPTVTVTIGPT